MQKFVNKLSDWTKENLLKMATDKCESFHFQPNNNKTIYKYDETAIPQHEGQIRDLGVHLSPDFTFNYHIQLIINKAKQKLYLLLKTLQSNDPNLLAQLYNVYVRPHLEYCAPIFNPQTKKLSDKLERAQRLATRIICKRKPNLKTTSYEDRLNALNLISLKNRRTAGDLDFFHKIYFNKALVDTNIPGFPRLAKTLPRHEGTRFVTPICKTKVRQNSFLIRTANSFNYLPRNLKLKFKQKNFKGLVLYHLCGGNFKGN